MTSTSIFLNKQVRDHLTVHSRYHSLSRRIGCTAERYDAITREAVNKIHDLYDRETIKELKNKVQTGYYIKMLTIMQLYTTPESFSLDQYVCDTIKGLSAVELIALIEEIEACE